MKSAKPSLRCFWWSTSEHFVCMNIICLGMTTAVMASHALMNSIKRSLSIVQLASRLGLTQAV
jgi:hypothetical protein